MDSNDTSSSTKGLEHFRKFFIDLLTPFVALRAPIMVALIGVVLLGWPSQTHEIYRALALNPESQIQQIGYAYITLTLACLLIWYIARNITLQYHKDSLQKKNLSGFLFRWQPRICGALPLLGAAFGIWTSSQQLLVFDVPGSIEVAIPGVLDDMQNAYDQIESAKATLKAGSIISIGLAVALTGITFLRSFKKSWKYQNPNPLLFGLGLKSFFFVLATGLFAALSIIFFVSPRDVSAWAGYFGALAIFNVFLLCIAFLVSFFANIYDRTGIHALWLIIILAVVTTAFNLNDNHIMRTLDREMISIPSPAFERRMRNFQAEAQARTYEHASDSFEKWLESRPDRDYYVRRGRPYPVFIVSAQGGGLYAAYQAAMTLARLQDRCGAFAQHVFVISGVSGGGLGGALFSSLVKTNAKPLSSPQCSYGDLKQSWYQDKVEKFLENDFMAPLTAAGFFPDFFQRFIPYPIARFDRARALEASFERAWDVTFPGSDDNPMASSYHDLWSPTGLNPALILNSTEMNSGRRFVFSPFHFRRQTSDRLITFLQLIRQPVALSTAVGVSARFPWILPPASWKVDPITFPRQGISENSTNEGRTNPRKRLRNARYFRFLDGGIFEYSGVETALDIVQILENLQISRAQAGIKPFNIDIQQIVLSDDEIIEDATSSRNFFERQEELTSKQGFGEVLSPVTTLLNARTARASLSVTRIFNRQCKGCVRSRRDYRELPGFDGGARLFRINHTDFSLTVGWQLSPATRDLISAHSGIANNCFALPRQERTAGFNRPAIPWMVKVINENNCAACRIVYDLSAQPFRPDTAADTTASTVSQSAGDDNQRHRQSSFHPYQLDIPAEGRLLCQSMEKTKIAEPLSWIGSPLQRPEDAIDQYKPLE